MAASIRINGSATPVETIRIGDTVSLTNFNNTGVTTWAWQIAARPAGSSAVLSSASSATPTFVADLEGSYRIHLTTNGADTDTAVCRILSTHAGLKLLARDEIEEGDASGIEGWALPMRQSMQLIDKRLGMTVKKTVYFTGTTTTGPKVLKVTGSTTLPNGDIVPTADLASISAGFGALVFFDSTGALTQNTAVQVVEEGMTGLFADPDTLVIEDAVYMGLTAGGLTKTQSSSDALLVGYCTEVSGGNRRIWFSPGFKVSVGGGTVTGSGANGRVAFWGGASSLSSNANLFWDNSTSALGVGVPSPTRKLEVSGDGSLTGVLGPGQFATGSLPSAAANEGFLAYDTTTNTIKFSDGATWADVGTGSGTIAIGDAVTGSSNGSILYSNAGNLAQSNSALYWDYTNSRLGIGNSGPTKTLDVTGQGVFSDILGLAKIATGSLPAAGAGNEGYLAYDDTTNTVKFSNGSAWGNIGSTGIAIGDAVTSSSNGSILYSNAGNLAQSNSSLYWDYTNTRLGIGNSGPTKTLDVTGQGVFSDILGLAKIVTGSLPAAGAGNEGYIAYDDTTNTVKFSDGSAWTNIGSGSGMAIGGAVTSSTNGSILYSNAGNLAQSNSALYWDYTNSRLGIGNSGPTKTLDVTGQGVFSDILGLAKIATGSLPAAGAGNTGYLAYDSTTNTVKFSDGSSWANIGSGVNAMAAIGAVPNANGASISGTTLTLQPASASFGGIVTSGTQTINGLKTFQVAGTGDVTIVESLDTTGIGNGLRIVNNAGSFGHPGLSFTKATVHMGSLNGYDSAAFGMVNGITLSSPTGKDIGFRVNQTSVGQFKSTGDFLVDTDTFYVDSVNNRVGVGTSAPTMRMEVKQNQNADTALQVTNANGSVGGNSTAHPLVRCYDGSKEVTLINWPIAQASGATKMADTGGLWCNKPNGMALLNTACDWKFLKDASGTVTVLGRAIYSSGNFEWDGTTFNIDAANNRIGIGTASPSEALQVVGNVRFSGALLPNNLAGTSGQVLTSAGTGAVPTWTTPAASTSLSAVGSTPNANGATVTGTVLNLQPADASFPGVVTTAAQTFAGSKTFDAKPILNAVVLGLGQIATGSLPTASSHTGSIAYDSTTSTVKFSDGSAWGNISTGVTTMAAVSGSGSANGAAISGTTLTLQPASVSDPGVVTIGTQTLAGAKTFNSALTVSASSGNVFVVNTNNLVVDATSGRVGINNAAPAYALDVVGTTSLAGATAITGRLTMSGAPTVYGSETGITALAGGGQSGATAIRYEVSFVTTAASAGDSVLLPTASIGQRVVIFNITENAIDVFPKSGVTIDWLGSNTAVSIPAHGNKEFYGLSATQWYSR